MMITTPMMYHPIDMASIFNAVLNAFAQDTKRKTDPTMVLAALQGAVFVFLVCAGLMVSTHTKSLKRRRSEPAPKLERQDDRELREKTLALSSS
jgi:hypothetical protein